MKYPEKLQSVPFDKDESRLFVPIFEGSGEKNNVIGVIRCVQKKKADVNDLNRFRQEDVEILTTIANTISMFCANYKIMKDKDIQKDEFVEAMGHEALIPLTAMKWHVDYLEEYHKRQDSKRIKQKFKDLKDEIEYLRFSLSSMPVLLGSEPYSFKPVKIFSESIFRCKSLTQNFLDDKMIQLEFNEEDIKEIPYLYLDQQKIHCVIYNLIHNAVKYSDKNTTITIKAWKDFDGYYISIENYGLGVRNGEEGKIFMKYGRGSNVVEKGLFGTGLGLCACRKIMECHGGCVTLTRKRNPTIFTIFFPKNLENRGPT